jgi:acyl-CoA synthetase (AMP-forming)/AMP-acid ligase II
MTRNLTGAPEAGLLEALTGPQVPTDGADAVTVGVDSLSREQLLAAAAAVADRVHGAGAVAVDAGADLRTVVAVVGCLLAGVPVIPLAPDSGPAERAHLLADSAADLVLQAGDIDLAARSASRYPEPPATSTALILYTSGTTGPPKGVPISRAAIVAGLDALAEAWAWTKADTLVHGLPLFHVHGLVLGVLGPLRIGSALRHTGRPQPAAYAAAAERGGSLFFGVPTVWSRIAGDPGAARALRSARLLVSGSAPLPVPVFEQLSGLTGHRPVERYGMTETLITLSTRADGERRPGVVGRPLPGVSTRLMDDGRLLPADGEAIGELQVRGPMVFTGYLGRPDADAEAFTSDGWFRTGDVVTIAPDGTHRIVGRASTDLIKSGGYKIGAGEVEDALLAVPGVRQAAVIGTAHPDLGEQVTAYVVAEGVSEQQLIDHVAGYLSVHKRPRQVVFVDDLPRNPLGKVLKRQLGS